MKNDIVELLERLAADEATDLPDFCADRDSMIAKEHERISGYMIGNKDAELLPTWVMATAKGQVVVMATPFGDANHKDLIAHAIRKFMREANVVRYAFSTEAWLATPTKEEWDAGDRRAPSEREDRVEVVMIIAADKDGFAMRNYQIVRDEAGQITALELLKHGADMAGFSGRFANMLEE